MLRRPPRCACCWQQGQYANRLLVLMAPVGDATGSLVWWGTTRLVRLAGLWAASCRPQQVLRGDGGAAVEEAVAAVPVFCWAAHTLWRIGFPCSHVPGCGRSGVVYQAVLFVPEAARAHISGGLPPGRGSARPNPLVSPSGWVPHRAASCGCSACLQHLDRQTAVCYATVSLASGLRGVHPPVQVACVLLASVYQFSRRECCPAPRVHGRCMHLLLSYPAAALQRLQCGSA